MTRNNMIGTVLWKPLFRGIIAEMIPHSYSHHWFSLIDPLDKCVQAWKEKLKQDIRKIHISLFKDDLSNRFHEYGKVQNFILKTGHSWQHCMLWTVTHFQSQVTCLSCCAIQSSHFKCNIFLYFSLFFPFNNISVWVGARHCIGRSYFVWNLITNCLKLET